MTAIRAPLNRSRVDALRAYYASPVQRRIEPWLRRMASLTQREEFAPAMLNRILGGEVGLVDATIQALNVSKAEERPTHSLAEAVTRYGYQEVRDSTLITGLHLCHNELAPCADLDPRALTLQAVAVWAAANELGDTSSAGLVANIGMGGLALAYGRGYTQLISAIGGGGTPLHEAERLAFGIDHASFGATMLRDSGFSEAICYDAEHHADAESGTEVIAVAEVVAHQMGFDGGMSNASAPLSSEALAGFGVFEHSAARVADAINNAVHWAEHLIG